MNRVELGRARAGAELIAAILLLFVGLRLLGFGAAEALHARRPAELGLSRSPVNAAPAPSEPPAPAPISAPIQPDTAPALSAGKALSVPLIVTAGPARAEVLVNGVKVGNSPFVGDVSCKAGETVRIDIVPARGKRLRAERACLPGTLRVGD